jgi:hypothetical protein
MRHFLIVITFLISCGVNAQVNINVEKEEDKSIELSNIVDEIEYVALESVEPIDQIRYIEYADSLFFVADKNSVFVFNRDGEFVRKFGQRGNGPKEYIYMSDLAVDPLRKLVFIRDHSKINIYDFNGLFKKSIKTDQFKNISSFKVIPNSDIVLGIGNELGDAKYLFVKLDLDGEVTSTYPNHIQFKMLPGGFYSNDESIAYSYKKSVGLLSKFNDTIFYFNAENFSAKYVLDKGKYELTPDVHIKAWTARRNHSSPMPVHIENVRLLETNKYFFYHYFIHNIDTYILGIYTKMDETFNKVASFELTLDMAMTNNYIFTDACLKNDIDNGIDFPFLFSFQENDETEFLGAYVDAFRIIDHIKNDQFQNSIPTFPEKKEYLKQFASTLKEDDNPILVIMKLKK